MSRLFTTNYCESLHSAVFTLAPKSVCYTRKFAAMCHSATHSRSVGPSRSMINIAQEAGLKVYKQSRFYEQLKLTDRQRQYDSRRQASTDFKQQRYYLRKRKSHSFFFNNDSLYSMENVASRSAIDHSYGLSS